MLKNGIRKTTALLAILLSLHLLFLLGARLCIHIALSKLINRHQDEVQIKYQKTHLDFFLRFLEFEDIQVIPKKHELGIFSISRMQAGNWGWENGQFTAVLKLKNFSVSSSGMLKNALELLAYQEDALNTDVTLLLTYSYKDKQFLANLIQETPQLGLLKLDTVLKQVVLDSEPLEKIQLSSIDLQYVDKSLLQRLVEFFSMPLQMTPVAFSKDFSTRYPDYVNSISSEGMKSLVQRFKLSPREIETFLLDPGTVMIRLLPKTGQTIVLKDLLAVGLEGVASQLDARIILSPKY